MCGIAGWIDWERDVTTQAGVVDAMAASLSRRGPDAAGSWSSPRAGLAHRRLAVIDPEGGAQPMVRAQRGGAVALVYNGEIYNHRELRAELEGRGQAFRTRSDTEVLLSAYLAWGRRCVERLRGMFAFAIWDGAREELLLARDPLGVKPIFYVEQGSAVLFGSEIKALLQCPLVTPEVDAEGLAEIFALGPVRTPGHGVLRGVRELRAGHLAVFRRAGAHVEAYWRLESRAHEDDLPTTAARIGALLRASVAEQLVADVPVGVLLSGGLDSSAIAACAAESRRDAGEPPPPSFALDFVRHQEHFRPSLLRPDRDTPWARRVAAHLGVLLEVVELDTPALVGRLLDAMRARDLPSAGEADASLLLLFERAKPQTTVLLSGESADEIFGGYAWMILDAFLPQDRFPWRFQATAALLRPEVRAAVRPEEYAHERYREALAEVPALPGEDAGEARRRALLHLALTRFLPSLLERKDRMSMAASIEVRVPFCDPRLVEYAWNVPWAMKLVGGLEKGILRQALRGALPDDVLNRRKSPYPSTHDPSYLRAVSDEVARILDDPGAPVLALVDAPAVRALVQRARGAVPGQMSDDRPTLDYLIQVNSWLREYRVSIRP